MRAFRCDSCEKIMSTCDKYKICKEISGDVNYDFCLTCSDLIAEVINKTIDEIKKGENP